MTQIIVYSSERCPFCIRQKEWMESHHIAFEERDIGNNPDYHQEFSELNAGGIPFTIIKKSGDEEHVTGFNKGKLEQSLLK